MSAAEVHTKTISRVRWKARAPFRQAKPVVGTDGFVSLVEKAADFFGEVFLSGIELFAIGLVQVLFGCRDA